MTRKTTTLILENSVFGGGYADTVEKKLREIPGVLRAVVNLATEVAYVEYDADQCSEAELERAVQSVSVHALRPPAA